jgi:hypothetical protein
LLKVLAEWQPHGGGICRRIEGVPRPRQMRDVKPGRNTDDDH